MERNRIKENIKNIENIVPMKNGLYQKIPKIRVIVRKRPPNQKEQVLNDIDIIENHKDSNTIIVKELK